MRDTEYSLGRWFGVLSRMGQNYVGRRCAHLGIGRGQIVFLSELMCNPGITQEELSNRLGTDKGTAARALQTLEKNGFVSRVRDESNRRRYCLQITEKALSIKEEFDRVLDDWDEILAEGFSNEEGARALQYLRLMAANGKRKL